MPNDHVLLTGASSGIGAALARELSAAGSRLTLVARREDRLSALARELPGPARVLARDLTDPDTRWLDEAAAELGPIDTLVNNAGMQVVGPTTGVDLQQAQRSMALNLHTPLLLIHALLPQMQERGGAIVNIASMAALAPPPGMTWYNATKGGLAAASESLHGELRRSGVRVLTVYPGVIADTAMGHEGLDAYEASWTVRLQPTATAAQLATAIRLAMVSEQPRLIYPRANALARWFPAPTRWLMDRLTPPVR